MHSQKSLIVLQILAAFANPICAQETEGKTERTVESPSPDGKFAFLAASQPDQEPKRRYDLIEKDSERVLLRVAESEEEKDRLTTAVLWSPDSKRFALTFSVVRLGNEVSVYFRTGETFREIKLPELPEAEVPERTKGGKHAWKWSAINSARAMRWQKDGSLVVEIESELVGGGSSMSAKRTVVIGFDKSDAAKIVKSTQKVSSHIEADD